MKRRQRVLYLLAWKDKARPTAEGYVRMTVTLPLLFRSYFDGCSSLRCIGYSAFGRSLLLFTSIVSLKGHAQIQLEFNRSKENNERAKTNEQVR